ncbi:Protein of unknown function [Gryllus bimaculatus]|nr:Protein of unknown function [Gryllus bimaculatus]
MHKAATSTQGRRFVSAAEHRGLAHVAFATQTTVVQGYQLDYLDFSALRTIKGLRWRLYWQRRNMDERKEVSENLEDNNRIKNNLWNLIYFQRTRKG